MIENINNAIFKISAYGQTKLADFNPDVKPDAPASLENSFTKLMNFLTYAGLVVGVAALIGAGIAFMTTHNKEDASESMTKLVKPLLGVGIIVGGVSLIKFIF